jgi:hypothetical protein
MATPLKISALEDLKPALAQLLDNPDEDFAPEISPDLFFTIKVNGKTWDGLIDARVAAYVTELQRAFDRTRRSIEPKETERRLVKVRIEDGSTDLVGKATDIFSDLVKNMPDNQKFIIALAFIGCAFLGWSLKQILSHIDQKEKERLALEKERLSKQNDAAAIEALSGNLRFVLEKIDPEKPMRGLVTGMSPDDTITLPGETKAITREEAKGRYPRKARITPIDVFIDDTYHVASLDLEAPIQLTLEKENFRFNAEFAHALKAEDFEAFLSRVKEAMGKHTAMRVSLQIDARVNDRAVIHAVIVGVEKPARSESQDIYSLLDL